MKDKKGFYSKIAAYLRKGIMVPIYSSDNLAVLRVADSFYIASDYTRGKSGYITFLVNSKMIRAMMVDDLYLTQLMTTADRETLATMLFEMDESTFRHMQQGKKGNLISDLQHRFVDEQLEQWVFETYGKPEITLPEPKKRIFKGLFKK